MTSLGSEDLAIQAKYPGMDERAWSFYRNGYSALQTMAFLNQQYQTGVFSEKWVHSIWRRMASQGK